LLTLNQPEGELPVGTHSVRGKVGWLTAHFSTGQDDDGRIYFRKDKDGQKWGILISRKNSQDRDIDNLLPGS
jgi:hypothetical protein